MGDFKLTKNVSIVRNMRKKLSTSSNEVGQDERSLGSEGKKNVSYVPGLNWDHIYDTLVAAEV